jgi:hypothetical protein
MIEVLISEKMPPINIHHLMQAVYGDKCVDDSTVRCWVRQLSKKWGIHWFKQRKKTFLMEECKNLLAGKSVLQLGEIMQNSDCAHMSIKVRGTLIFFFHSNISFP